MVGRTLGRVLSRRRQRSVTVNALLGFAAQATSRHHLFEQGAGAAKNNEAVLQAIIPIEDISSRLAEHIYPIVTSLYERFGIAELSRTFVDRQIAELISRRSDKSLDIFY